VKNGKTTIWATMAGLLTAAAALGALIWWLEGSPGNTMQPRMPEVDELAGTAQQKNLPKVNIEGYFQAGSGTPSILPAEWPCFRGSDSDNISKETVPLAESWPETGPPVLWSTPLGDGHAAPVVKDGRVYILDYDETEKADALRCLSMDDGQEIWRRWYHVKTKRNHGISRTIPAVDDHHVVTIGPKCHVLCTDAETGDFVWGKDMVAAYGTKVPLWYTGQCPILYQGNVILAPAGSCLLTAVNCATGKPLWETPNPDGWKMSHSSVVPMTCGGRRMFVYCAIGGVVGVAADGPDAGAVLWRTDAWTHSVVAPSPVPLPGNRLLLTAGYGAGSMMLRIKEESGAYTPEVLFELKKSTFACEQQTPILWEGHLYTVLPNDAGPAKQQFACLDEQGRQLWTSGLDNRFGLGPFLLADRKFFILDDAGTLTLAKADASGFRRLARASIVDGRDAWGPMVIVAGRLLMRESTRMFCLDVSAQATP
jgi:outer membrane protein assembly factor BamB